MDLHKITDIDDLMIYLHHAMQLEHATIPPYLMAMYSIKPGTNLEAVQTIRVVVVEEMLHLTLAANILNAVGGTPNLTAPDFVPSYPAYLPDGENEFSVDLQRFAPEAVETFLKIERPAKAPSEDKRVLQRTRTMLGAVPKKGTNLHFYSIGEFYEEIIRGLKYLHAQQGDKLFSGDRAKQVTSEYYYSGGGEALPVTDFDSALAAANLIISQGEGFGGGIYDKEDELSHEYRFHQLLVGRYYKPGDKPYAPTGEPLPVDYDAVYRIKTNARLTDYPGGSELYGAAVSFNESYGNFLALLNRAFNGEPQLLLTEAVPEMFVLRNRFNQLIRNPVPGMQGVNAAPTFEIVGQKVAASA